MDLPASTTALSVGNGPLVTTTLSFLSSRAKQRDLQFHRPFVEMFFEKANYSYANASIGSLRAALRAG